MVSKARAAAGAGSTSSPRLRITCYGTRGSIPTPGPATAHFGGNTSCVEARTADGACYIFDGGSGIRPLGLRLAAGTSPVSADLFISHFHWDHIQGLPFFAPLYNPKTFLRIHGARQDGVDIRSVFAGQMQTIYFPVPFEALTSSLEFSHLDGDTFRNGDVEVASLRVRHPAHTYGYRLNTGGASVVYIPDNELVGGQYAVGGKSFHDDMVAFLRGADVLFHDTMYTDQDYREGWGHSTYNQTVELAEEAGVRRLYCFHHAPERSDEELTRIVDDLRDDSARRGYDVEVNAATEGQEITA